MIKYGYHGTNTNIEVFDLKHLGSQQGQSVFPGIYFTSSYEEALYYANLAVEKSGGKPIVYLAECTLNKSLKGKEKFFPSFRDILDFTKKYFNNSNWFDSSGNLHSYKKGYLLEKQETYTGNYNFIKFAAKENNLETSEIIETEFGIDSKLDGGSDFAIISPQQINWFIEVDHNLSAEEITDLKDTLPAEESLETQPQTNYLAAFETKSNDYIRAAKHGKNYKTMPGNRFLRRVKIKTNGGNNVWFDLDINRLFKKGSFNLKIPVIGETAEYVCQISFDDWLPKLKDDILKTGFTQMTVKRSLMEMLRFHDLKVNCSCDDFCFTGETPIKLLDGRTLSLHEIVDEFTLGKKLWVYSSDEKGDFKPGEITDAFKTGEVDKLVEVELDSGEKIRCTLNHPLMLRDGSYIRADQLIVGQSLMPMYLRSGVKNYEQVKLNSIKTTTYKSIYKLVANELKSPEIQVCEKQGQIDSQNFNYRVAIHHKNFHKEDNSPDNLQIMTANEHWKLHYSLIKENGVFEKFLNGGKEYWATEEARLKQSQVAKEGLVVWLNSLTPGEKKEFYSRARSSIDWNLAKEAMSKGARRRWDSMTPEERREYTLRSINKPGVHTKESYEKLSKTLKIKMSKLTAEERKAKYSSLAGRPLTEEHRHKISIGHLGVKPSGETRQKLSEMAKNPNRYKWVPLIISKLKEANLSIIPENYDRVRLSLPLSSHTKVKAKWQNKFNTWDEVLAKFGLVEYNHSVKSIKILELDKPEPVYDLTVSKWHNFRLAAGIMVHNCYRHKYWLSVHNEIEGDLETRPSKITNPKDDLGKICKHLSMVMNNKIYGDKVSRIIYNYFINLKKTQKMLFDRMVAPKLGLDELDRRAEEARIKQEEAFKKQEEEELKMEGVEEPVSEEEKKKAVDEIDNTNSGDNK